MRKSQRWTLGVIVAVLSLTLSACGTQTSGNSTSTVTPKPHGWYPVLSQDFTQNAAIGQFEQVYGTNLYGYNGHGDTSGHAIYMPDQVLSAENGYLDYYVHSINGQPRHRSPSPAGLSGADVRTVEHTLPLRCDPRLQARLSTVV